VTKHNSHKIYKGNQLFTKIKGVFFMKPIYPQEGLYVHVTLKEESPILFFSFLCSKEGHDSKFRTSTQTIFSFESIVFYWKLSEHCHPPYNVAPILVRFCVYVYVLCSISSRNVLEDNNPKDVLLIDRDDTNQWYSHNPVVESI
jgi:hypothetical protein